MGEQRDVRSRIRSVPCIKLGYRSQMPNFVSLEHSKDSFQVVPVPLDAPLVSNKTNSPRIRDKERRRPSNKAKTGVVNRNYAKIKRQKPSSPRHGKTSATAVSAATDNKKDLSGWFLMGTRIQEPGCILAKHDSQRNFSNEHYFPPKKAEESRRNHPCSSLHTAHPPSLDMYSDPEHLKHTRQKHSESDRHFPADEDHRLWFPSLSSRPLGEPCTTTTTPNGESQRLRQNKQGGSDKRLDELLIAAGKQAQFSRRLSSRTLRSHAFSAQLRRTSSSNSLTN